MREVAGPEAWVLRHGFPPQVKNALAGFGEKF